MAFVLILFAAAGVLFGSQKHLAGMKQIWKDAALQLDMSFEQGGALSNPKISGRVGDVAVVIDTHKSNNENQSTRYQITHPPAGPPVRIRRQGPFHKVSRFFGGKDVEVGDPHFDDQVVVESAHPDQTRLFLTPSRQAAVLAVFNRWRYAEMTHDGVTVQTGGFEKDVTTIVRTVTQLVAIAQVMGHPQEVDTALGLQQQGELGTAIEELHGINERNPNVFTQLLEAEALVEHGEHERARDVIAPVVDAGLSEAAGWSRLADTPAPVLLPVPAQVVAPTIEFGQQELIEDLFGGQLMSFEIVERFEARYVNKRVNWSGPVTQVHSYRHDNDFGEGPGLKATVLLGSSGTGSLISNQVHAVVQLGVDEPVERGSEISFAGTLMHVDRFARKLYLSSGAVI